MKLKNKIIKDFKQIPIGELAETPVYAFYGITDRNALTLYKALRIETIRYLASIDFVKWAKEITFYADKGTHTIPENFKENLIKKYHDSQIDEIADGPIYALYGLSKKNAKLLKKDFSIYTIRDLAEFKYVKWAQNIDYKQKLIKDYENYSISDLLDAPVFALQGLSKKDSKLLKKAFNIETIKDLAELKFILWAREILELNKSNDSDYDMSSFENKLIKRYENKPLEKLIKAPIQALQGVSKKDADLIYEAFQIKTIEKFAELKYAAWARGLVDLHNSAADTSEIKEEDKKCRNIIFFIVIILSVIGLFFYNKYFVKNKDTVLSKKNDINYITEKTEDLSQDIKIIKEKKEKSKNSESEENFYTVKFGDTLISISEEKYKDYKKWRAVYRLNRKVISKPWEIYPGQKIKLPK